MTKLLGWANWGAEICKEAIHGQADGEVTTAGQKCRSERTRTTPARRNGIHVGVAHVESKAVSTDEYKGIVPEAEAQWPSGYLPRYLTLYSVQNTRSAQWTQVLQQDNVRVEARAVLGLALPCLPANLVAMLPQS